MKKILKALLSLLMVVSLNQIPVHATDLDTVIAENGYVLKEGQLLIWQTGNFDSFAIQVDKIKNNQNKYVDFQLSGNSFSILFLKDGEYVDELELGSVEIANGYLVFTLNDFITPTDMTKGDYDAYLVDNGNVYELYNDLNDGKLAFDPNNNLNSSGEIVPIGTKEDTSLKDSSKLNITVSQKVGSDELPDNVNLYNVTIKSSDSNYVKSIKKIIFFDGDEQLVFNINLNKNCYIDSNGHLVIYYSELNFLSPLTYKANIFAEGYTKYIDGMFGLYARIFTPVSDVQLNPTNKGLEIISSNYNYINGFTKPDLEKIKTKGYIKFTKDGKTIEINNLNEGLADKVYKKSNGKYYVVISKDKLLNHGVEGNVKYNVVVKPTNFEETSSKSSYAYKLSKVIPISSITLDQTNTSMLLGSTLQLTATINPSNTTDPKLLTWTSSDESILTVENGIVTAKAVGTATITVTTTKGKTATCTINVIESNDIIRIYGDARYQTAMFVANALKEELGIDKFETVIIATGIDYPDALAGSYLAGKKNAPILMINERYMDDVVAYVKNNLVAGGKVYILGGVNAVPQTLESKLSGYDITRFAGSNRFETNLMILKEAQVTTEELLICTGYDYADSLSASATERPIMLVHPKSGLNDKQKEFLNTVKGNKMYVIGGLNAVNNDIYNTVSNYAGSIERIGGSDRNETSVLITKEFFDSPACAVVAYSRGFADGLAGGPLAIAKKAPLILVQSNKTIYATDYMTTNNIKSGAVLGGPKLVSDEAIINIFNLK